METLKKVLICSAIVVGIVFVAFIYDFGQRLRGFKEANNSGAPFEWLAVTNGETRQQLAHALGAPIRQSASNVDLWRKGNATLRVTYDENDRATNVWREGVWTLVVPFDENEHNTNAANQRILK